MKRILSFDYIRAFAVCGIVACHSCFGIIGWGFLGKFLGSTFNFMFIILSAFLLGIKWQKENRCAYGIGFLKHRIGKLAVTYWLFLALMFSFLFFVGYNISVKNVLMHIFFLGWFDKIDGFGHLWFMTLIVLCYTACMLVSKLPPRLVITACTKEVYVFLLLLLTISLQCVLSLYSSLPNYAPLYLLLFLLVFVNANRILDFVLAVPLKITVVTASVLIPFFIYMFYSGCKEGVFSAWMGIISAVLLFILWYKLFRNARPNVVVCFISAYSFEIYLVHHVFCFGEYSLFGLTDSVPFGLFLIVCTSALLAFILKRAVSLFGRVL